MKLSAIPLVISIKWDGPYTIDNVEGKSNDLGIYQIYGTHPVSGPNTLLYIGQESDPLESFEKHYDWFPYELDDMKIYVGKLFVNHEPFKGKDDYEEKLVLVKKLLIYHCAPPYNMYYIPGHDLKAEFNPHIIVLNLWKKAMLPYEVSTIHYQTEDWNKSYNFLED